MRLAFLLCLTVAAQAQDKHVDAFFKGKVTRIRGRRVSLRYDFSHEVQLQDFITTGKARIEDGRLLIEAASSATHRAVASGVRARVVAKVHKKRDLGLALRAGDTDLVLDVFDHKYKTHEGLLLATFNRKAKNAWRTIASATALESGRFFGFDKPVEIELTLQGARVACRLQSLYRIRNAEAPPASFRFSLWAEEGSFELDRLDLEVELDEAFVKKHGLLLSRTSDDAFAGQKIATLVKIAKEKPLSVQAAGARRELSRRGDDGWKRLYAMAKGFLRKQAYRAVPVIEALADGTEPGRRAYLRKLAKPKSLPTDARMAIVRGLLAWYPEDAELVHEGLALKVKRRRAFFRELVAKAPPDEVLRAYAKDKELAEEVHSILKDRGLTLNAADLGDLPRIRARQALSPAAARAFLEDFRGDRNWALVRGLTALLKDADKDVARGAYLLLLTLSGRDLAPDADLWKSWIAAKKDSYEAPGPDAPGVAAAAIMRGAEFLQKDLLDDGASVWPQNEEWPGIRVGATALSVYALRAAGVPASDPAIQKALHKTLLLSEGGVTSMRGDLQRYTYALSLLALALHAVDAKANKAHLELLAKRLCQGQCANGQWTYYCHDDYKKRPRAGDNSNTQYAILALRACRLAGVQIPPEIWQKNAAYWLGGINAWGGWGYGPKGTTLHELSMTSAGVSTYAICMEGLHGTDAVRRLRESKRVKFGMLRLGELLLVKGYKGAEIYAFYGVERACILTATRAFNEFDWYREGAGILVSTQKESGAWGDPEARGVATGRGYGEAIDTAYALLFLKRATTGLPGAAGGGVVKVTQIRPKTVEGHK